MKITQLKNWFWKFYFTYSVVLLNDFVEKMSSTFNFKYFQGKKIPKEESITAACESLEEIQNKNMICLEKKESNNLLNSHRNMAMQPQFGNSRKSFDPYWKYCPSLG